MEQICNDAVKIIDFASQTTKSVCDVVNMFDAEAKPVCDALQDIELDMQHFLKEGCSPQNLKTLCNAASKIQNLSTSSKLLQPFLKDSQEVYRDLCSNVHN